MAHDFNDLKATLGALTNNFTAANLAKMNKTASTIVRRENTTRIRANRTPDGMAMKPRKPQKQFAPKTAVKFLYPAHGSGKARLVVLRLWTIKRGMIIGFDEKSGGVRHFLKSKIIRFLPCDLAGGSFKDNSVKAKRGKMFKKLPSPKFFKTQSNANGFKVGFTEGRAANIAPIHHFGSAPQNIPERPLLGITEKDEDLILESYIAQIDF